MKKFTVEFAVAMAVHTLLMAWYFRAPILRGQVDSVEARNIQPPDALTGMSEMVYEVQAAISVQTREIKQGIFPAWDPYSQGGTPLIGKMQNAVFAPHHLPLYILPMSWMPYLFTLIVLLKSYLAFAFAYLYARSLRLDLWSGIFSGSFFVFSIPMLEGSILSWFGTGLYLPLLLLLVECCFQGRRKSMMFLWPWAAALPFFSGHFEGAFRINLAAAIYFLLRLRADKMLTNKWGHGLRLAGLSAVGAAVAGIQIYPAYEYVDLSYNKIWHTLDWFGWEYETIFKHLSSEDMPMLAAGFCSLAAFYFLLRRFLSSKKEGAARRFANAAAASACCAAAIACLAQVGLNDSLNRLNFTLDDANAAGWAMGIVLLILAFWAWRQRRDNPGLRALGQVMIGGMFVTYKTPVIANLLLHLPIIRHFHNASLHRWEYNLGVAVLTAAALEKLMHPDPTFWEERLNNARRAFAICGLLAAGYLASQPLRGVIGRWIPTGTPPALPGDPAPPGGTMGPEHAYTYQRSYSLAGWVPPYPPVSKIDVALVPGNQSAAAPVEVVPASLERTDERLYFYAALPITDAVRRQDNVRAIVQAKRDDGSQQALRGTLIQARAVGTAPWHPYALIAVFLATPLLLLAAPAIIKGFFIAMMILCAMQYKSAPIPAGQIPYRLPAIEKVRNDPQPFRLSSLQYTFMQADYPNVYGLSDLRTGGDNLDVLTMIHFFHLSNTFLTDIKDTAAFDIGLRLWGLANTKYLIDYPKVELAHPGLEPYYQGPDMSVWKNKYLMPRSIFFDRYVYLPVKNWSDWLGRGQFLGPIMQMVRRPDFDWAHTLLLHDQPSAHADLTPAPAVLKESTVEVSDYRPDRVRLKVQATKPGFVFLSDNYFPGWQAKVNGKSVKILQSWITFRAVEVPAGDSTVEFTYRPFLLHLLLLSASCIAAGWAFLYLRYLASRHSPYSPLTAAPPAKDKKKKNIPSAQTLETPAAVADCAAFAEWILVPWVGCAILFWTAWCAFALQEGALVPWLARGLLVGFAVWGLIQIKRMKSGSTQSAG